MLFGSRCDKKVKHPGYRMCNNPGMRIFYRAIYSAGDFDPVMALNLKGGTTGGFFPPSCLIRPEPGQSSHPEASVEPR